MQHNHSCILSGGVSYLSNYTILVPIAYIILFNHFHWTQNEYWQEILMEIQKNYSLSN